MKQAIKVFFGKNDIYIYIFRCVHYFLCFSRLFEMFKYRKKDEGLADNFRKIPEIIIYQCAYLKFFISILALFFSS